MEIAGSILNPALGLGFFMRGKSLLFESLCFMEWMIGIREFEIFWMITKGCEGAWSLRICWISCEKLCHFEFVFGFASSRISLRH